MLAAALLLTALTAYRHYRETPGAAAGAAAAGRGAGDSLVLYTGDRCPYCVKFKPNGIRTIPTVIAYRGGVEHKRYTGDDADKFVIDHAP